MENTLSNKGKFFAQYWGQKIMLMTVNEDNFYQKIGFSYMNKYKVENCHIELKPLSSITDEDAKSLGYRSAKHFKPEANEIFRKDELRSLGYAVEWMGLSVEDQIEYGWVNLKTD